jgi:hypothetical protein
MVDGVKGVKPSIVIPPSDIVNPVNVVIVFRM